MTANNSTYKTYRIYQETYDSCNEFYNAVHSKTNANEVIAHYAEQSSFTMVSSYEEAETVITQGFNSPIATMNRLINDKLKQLAKAQKPTLCNDIAGFMPNVPNALLGLPNSMINTKLQKIAVSRVIDFYVSNAYPWRVSTTKVVNFFAEVLADIIAYERKGYRCNIWLVTSVAQQNHKNAVFCKVKLKDAKDYLNVAKLAFYICHPASFRVYSFAWYHNLPSDINTLNHHGKGISLNLWNNQETVNGLLQKLNIPKERFIQFKE